MPEARDRLIRGEEDLMGLYSRRRRAITNSQGAAFVIYQDQPQVDRATTTTMVGVGASGTGRRFGSGTPRINGRRTPVAARVIGRENISPMVQGRGQGQSVLPSWYPRTPLRDITFIVRAIERRRARLRESEGQQLESPMPQDQTVLEPFESTSGAQLEHSSSFMTPHSTSRSRHCLKSVGKVPKILLDITQQNEFGDSDSLTPQRKLLNSIENVEKAAHGHQSPYSFFPFFFSSTWSSQLNKDFDVHALILLFDI